MSWLGATLAQLGRIMPVLDAALAQLGSFLLFVGFNVSQHGRGYMMLEPKWSWTHMIHMMHAGVHIIHIWHMRRSMHKAGGGDTPQASPNDHEFFFLLVRLIQLALYTYSRGLSHTSF